jgi:hypothetical protein
MMRLLLTAVVLAAPLRATATNATTPTTNDERDLAGVVAGGSQPRDRRARREVAHPRTAERHYDDR